MYSPIKDNVFRSCNSVLEEIRRNIQVPKKEIVNIFFSDCTFDSSIQFRFLIDTLKKEFNIGSLNFTSCSFNCYLDLQYYDQTQTLKEFGEVEFNSIKRDFNFTFNYESCTFNNNVEILGIKFTRDINFTHCIFQKKFAIVDVHFNSFFRLFGSTFTSSTLFQSCELNCKTIFLGMRKEKGDENTKFNGPLEFIDITFIDDALFWYFDFNDNVNFLGTQFNKKAKFSKSKFLKRLYIGEKGWEKLTEFKCAVEFDNTIINELELENFSFDGPVSFANSSITTVSIQNVRSYDSPANFDNINRDCVIKDEDTARFLKQETLKSGNLYLSNFFRSEEIKLHKPQDLWERLSLNLSKLSNNYGRSYIKAIAFTIISWIATYILYLISSRFDAIMNLFQSKAVVWRVKEGIADSISFIWSTDFLKILIDWIKSINHLGVMQICQIFFSVLIFIIGKILIAYGIVQTIAAFRKDLKF